ncbi:NERD domain-containing protein [Elusimicrobiota bacterium]
MEIIIIAFVCILFLLFGFLLPSRISGERGVVSKLESLQRENEEYHPFNNIILKTPDGTTQIDHILISPYGIFVIETKDYKGWIFGDENQKKWTQSLFGPRHFSIFGSEYSSTKHQFMNPIHQNYKHVKAVQNFLNVDPKAIFNVVVFAGTAEFKTDMPENVRSLYDLLPYIKSYKEILFNREKVEKLSKIIRDYVELSSVNEDDHIRNLKNNIENPICPRCGKPMVLRKARKGARAGSEFWGCSNFPKCKVTKNLRN